MRKFERNMVILSVIVVLGLVITLLFYPNAKYQIMNMASPVKEGISTGAGGGVGG